MIVTSSLVALALAQVPAGAVEVPFRIGENAIIVDATVNNHKVSLMFDTGFSGTVNLSSDVNVGTPTGHVTLRDFVGEFDAPTVKIKSLRLGEKTIDPGGKEVVMTPPEDYSFAYGQHVDGIMGLSVINDYTTEINFEKHKFIFYPKSYDISTKKVDGKKTFLTKLLPIGHVSLEMRVVAPNGEKMILALDTGNAFYATTHKDVLERAGLWKSGQEPKYMSSAGVASGTVDSWYKRLTDMTIFGVPVKSSVWSIIDRPSGSAESDGTIGFGFLKHFNITFDADRRLVFFDNWTGKTADDEPAEVGISAGYWPEKKKVVVFRVSPDSPAEKAGVKAGDELLSIDNEDLVNSGARKIRRMLGGQKGSKVKLAVSRDGQLQRFELERVELVND